MMMFYILLLESRVELTYSKQNLEGFPKYEKFADIYAVKEFIEQQ